MYKLETSAELASCGPRRVGLLAILMPVRSFQFSPVWHIGVAVYQVVRVSSAVRCDVVTKLMLLLLLLRAVLQ